MFTAYRCINQSDRSLDKIFSTKKKAKKFIKNQNDNKSLINSVMIYFEKNIRKTKESNGDFIIGFAEEYYTWDEYNALETPISEDQVDCNIFYNIGDEEYISLPNLDTIPCVLRTCNRILNNEEYRSSSDFPIFIKSIMYDEISDEYYEIEEITIE